MSHNQPSSPKLPPKSYMYAVLDEETKVQRANVIKELIDSEILLNEQMSFVSQVLSNCEFLVPITAEDLAAVKVNLDDYLSASDEIILSCIKAISEAPGEDKHSCACVAMHMIPNLPKYCQVMIDYIKGYEQEILEHRPQLRNYFSMANELLQEKEDMKTTMPDVLYKLFQRPFNVKKILILLEKFTPEYHPDYIFAVAAKNAIRNACIDVDAYLRKNAGDISSSNYRGSPEVSADGNDMQKSGWIYKHEVKIGSLLPAAVPEGGRVSRWLLSRRLSSRKLTYI